MMRGNVSLKKIVKLKKIVQIKMHFDKYIENCKHNKVKPKAAYNRRWWVRPTNRKRWLFGLHKTLIREMREYDEEEFFRFTRMSVSTFDELLSLTQHLLQKHSQRESIAPDIRLYITLRCLNRRKKNCSFSKKIFTGFSLQVIRIIRYICCFG